MKQLQIHPGYLVSVMLFAVICVLISLDRCNSKPKLITEFYTDTLIVPGDPYPVYAETKPKIIYRDSIKVIPANMDTGLILRDYFNTYSYLDTLKNDSSALVIVSDTVTQNRVISRGFTFQNRRETAYVINNTTVTHIRKEPLFKLGLGISGFYYQKSKSFDIAPNVTLITRPGFYAGYSYLIAGQGHGVTAGWVVRSRK